MITLRGITWEHPRGFGSVHGASPHYQSLNSEVTIQWEFRSLQAFADHPIEELVKKFDLLVIDHPHIPFAAENELLSPFIAGRFQQELELFESQSVGRSFESYSYMGRQWALPIDAAAQVSAFVPGKLDSPPEDWDGVRELAKAGKVLWPLKPIDAYSSLITLAANAGTPPMQQSDLFLEPEKMLSVLSFMHEIISFVPDECFGLNPIQVADLLCQDSEWFYSPLLFGYSNYSREGFRNSRLKYSDIPSGSEGVRGSLLGGAGIAVSAFSPNQEAAQEFAMWLNSAVVQRTWYYQYGGQPGNSVAWEDDALNADSLDFFRGTRATLEGAYLRPRHPRYMQVQDLISPLVTDCLRGNLTDAVLVEMSNQIVAQIFSEDREVR